MNIITKIIGGVAGGLLAALVIIALCCIPALLGGLVGWLLWNHALAALFHGPQISYWQAVGIVWILSILGSIFRRLS